MIRHSYCFCLGMKICHTIYGNIFTPEKDVTILTSIHYNYIFDMKLKSMSNNYSKTPFFT